MNFISKLFKKNVSEAEEAGKGSVEEFVSLIRVYYQAVMAVNLGITLSLIHISEPTRH